MTFDISVWICLGHASLKYELYSGTAVIEVAEAEEPEPEDPEDPEPEVTLADELNAAIENGDYEGSGPITLFVDGEAYVFTSNSGNYNGFGSLFCTVDGLVYRLERNKHGLIGVYIN